MPVGEPEDDQDDERGHDDDREDHRADGDDVQPSDVGVGEHGDEHGPDAPDLPRVQLRPPCGDVALHQGEGGAGHLLGLRGQRADQGAGQGGLAGAQGA